MKDKKKIAMGKKSRAAGARFELRVRVDMERKGWILDKWSNNIELEYDLEVLFKKVIKGKLIKAKPKFVFNPQLKRRIPMGMSSGFPDFIAFKYYRDSAEVRKDMAERFKTYEVIGVESKMTGILDKTEKEKCKWLLDNNIFSKILIAKKGKKRGEIEYNEFK